MAIKFNRNFNVTRVIGRVIRAILALYVGGTVLTQFGTVMNGTTSSLYTGLGLIGWTVTSNTIHSTSGSGILGVIGILAIAQVVLEFITW